MPITTEEPTPCFGRSDLFDSIELADHREAALLCIKCHALEACKRLLADVQASSGSGAQPEGTWAGRRFGSNRLTPAQIAQEDKLYTDQEARMARSMYQRGDRSEWVVSGNRAYARRTKRNQKRVA